MVAPTCCLNKWPYFCDYTQECYFEWSIFLTEFTKVHVYHECLHFFLIFFCVSVASGTWSFSLYPLILARTSSLRKALTTSPQRIPRGALLPCCPRPRSSPCSSTPLTEPTAGIRYIHKQNTLRAKWLHMHYFCLPLPASSYDMLHLCIDLQWVLYPRLLEVLFFSVSEELMSLIYLYAYVVNVRISESST